MYQFAFNKIKKSIFPIFSELKQENNTNINICGIGFFIDSKGHFITANHILDRLPKNATALYFGNSSYNSLATGLKIVEIYKDERRDIFLGKIELNNSVPVDLSYNRLSSRMPLHVCGYLTRNNYITTDTNHIAENLLESFETTFIIDSFTGVVNDKFYQGYLTEPTSFNGPFGGPVFDLDGMVHGIDIGMITHSIQSNEQHNQKVLNRIVLENMFVKDIYDFIL